LLASEGAESIPGRGRYLSSAPGSPRCPVLVATVSDRSPGDFHSTGAPYVPHNDSRGTKPARATSVTVTQKGYIKGLQALRNKYTRKLKRAPASLSFSRSEARPHGYGLILTGTPTFYCPCCAPAVLRFGRLGTRQDTIAASAFY
jgi:hypothetical protein